MKKLVSWMTMHCGHMIASLALLVATVSVGTTCIFNSYQPEVPESLRER